MPSTAATTDPLWYKDAVIYQLHIKAFADSNGDGIGDFRGLIGRLDYLQNLGVDTVWLLPFYPSPLRDDGYDIADYDTVNPIYGSVADFEEFLALTHDRALRVITELVINHTSDQHEWFQRARRAPKGSPERDFYVWSDTPEPYAETRIIFEDFEPSNWTWDPVAEQFFWHRFYSHQPDLNFDNPAVHEAVFEAMDKWLEMGVDGIRLDAIPYLYEREGTNCENLRETHDFLKLLRARMDERFPGRMFLAEANQWPEDTLEYFGDGDECHTAFHFPVMPRLYMALAREDYHPITDILEQTPPIPPACQWVMFLRNHDELTLEMVTDEERAEMRNHYAPDRRMRINAGIRRRLAPLMGGDRRRIELMNALLFSMPGTPVLYYGDEIGMGDNVWLPDRDGVRTPMQWTAGTNAGFSTANPQQLYLPVITDPRFHYEHVNVAAQIDDPASQWSMIHRLIEMRKSLPILGRGGSTFLKPDNSAVLAFVRTPEKGSSDEPLLVIVNLSGRAQQVELAVPHYKGRVPVDAFGGEALAPIGSTPYPLTLGPYGFLWLSLTKTKTRRSPANRALPVVDRAELGTGSRGTTLPAALSSWLSRQQWLPGAERVRSVKRKPDNTDNPVMQFEVDIAGRGRRIVALLLAEVRGADADRYRAAHPESVIAESTGGALLVEGSYVPQAIRRLLPAGARPAGTAFEVTTSDADITSQVGRIGITLHRCPLPGDNEEAMHSALQAAGFRAMSQYLGGDGLVSVRRLPAGTRLSAAVSVDAVRAAGRALGGFHRALATVDDPAFTPQPFTSLYQRALYQGIHSAATAAGRRNLGIDAEEVIERVEGLRRGVLQASRQRIHGYVGLDSFIWDGTAAHITGYGGQPGRPADEQALKRSPLRDIAQFLCAIEDGRWTKAEQRSFADALWHGYLASAAMVPDPAARDLLLDVFKIEHRLAR